MKSKVKVQSTTVSDRSQVPEEGNSGNVPSYSLRGDSCDGDSHFFFVADGVGGRQRGVRARQLLHLELIEVCEQEPPADEDERTFARRLRQSISDVGKHTYAGSVLSREGVTLVMAATFGDRLLTFHMGDCLGGDCSLYILRAGRLIRMTDDHTLLSETVEQRKVYVTSTALRQGDVVLLLSLGVTKVLGDDVIREVLVTYTDQSETLDEIRRRAVEGGCADHIALTIICFQSATLPLPLPTPEDIANLKRESLALDD